MALEFLISNKPKAAFNGIKTITLDASIDESHNYQALVTSNPVETGAKVTDNVLINPLTLSITGFITDTPIKLLFGLLDNNNESGSGSLSATAHQDLLILFKNKQPFQVVTGLDIYKDMVITRLTFPRNNKTGRSLRFNCQLVQILRATFLEQDIPDENISETQNAKNQGSEKKEVGDQTANGATAAETERSSLFYKIFN